MASGSELLGSHGGRWRFAGWGIAIGLLILPFVAMQFTREVAWTGSDFVFAAVLIGGVGLLFELAVRLSNDWDYRGGIALALLAALLTIWANGAVGMIGDEGNPLNWMFTGVLGLALAGTLIAGFRARGMALAMSAAAAAQLLAGIIGIFTDLRGGIFSALFALLWLASAAMFRRAGRG